MAISTEERMGPASSRKAKPFQFPSLQILSYAPWLVAILFLLLATGMVYVPSLHLYLSAHTVPLLLVVGLCSVAVGLLALDLRKLLDGVTAYGRIVRSIDEGRRSIEDGVPSQAGLEGLARSLNHLLSRTMERDHSSMELVASNRVLARELDRLFLLVDSLSDPLIAADSTGRIIFANRAAGLFLNVSPGDARGKMAKECIENNEIRRLVVGQGEDVSVHGARTVDLPPDPKRAKEHYSVTCSFGTEEDDTMVGQVLLFRDVSYVKKVERQQAEFIDGTARELLAPLGQVRSATETLMANEAMDDTQRYGLYTQIHEETYRLSRLVEGLQHLTLIESGAAALDVGPVLLGKLLEDCIELLRPQAVKREIELVAELPERLPTINVDKRLITIAIMNVLDNAVKYTRPQGAVQLSTSSNDEEITISIIDSGIGISEHHIGHIFEKFYRVEPADDSMSAGSGIGLATAVQIIRLHGGDIRVSSREEQGSQFSLLLPRSVVAMNLGE